MSKRLTRSRDHKIIGGVCGGLGEYFSINPLLFRFVFIALLMAGGSSFLIYLILLVVIPKEPVFNTRYQASDQEGYWDPGQAGLQREPDDSSSRLVIGLILITAGVLILLHNLVPYFRLEKLWPVVLVIIGLGLIFQKSRGSWNDKGQDHKEQE